VSDSYRGRRQRRATRRTAGPSRRYYQFTSDGELALASFTKQWTVFRDAVAEILSEGSQQ
jgi:hypothetical protein